MGKNIRTLYRRATLPLLRHPVGTELAANGAVITAMDIVVKMPLSLGGAQAAIALVGFAVARHADRKQQQAQELS